MRMDRFGDVLGGSTCYESISSCLDRFGATSWTPACARETDSHQADVKHAARPCLFSSKRANGVMLRRLFGTHLSSHALWMKPACSLTVTRRVALRILRGTNRNKGKATDIQQSERLDLLESWLLSDVGWERICCDSKAIIRVVTCPPALSLAYTGCLPLITGLSGEMVGRRALGG